MPYCEERTQMAAKLESVEGVAEVLAAADGFLAFPGNDPEINPEINPRNPYRETFSTLPGAPGKYSGKIQQVVELAGSGVAGTPPPWGKLMKGAGFGETIAAGVSVAYAPASAAIPSLTVAAYLDGLRHLVPGCRGSLKVAGAVGKPFMATFDWQGGDSLWTDLALLVGIPYSAIIAPTFQGAACTVGGYTFYMDKIEFDFGNKLALRVDHSKASGHKSAVYTGREPKMTLDPEMVSIASKDVFGMLKSGATMALAMSWGTASGNILAISAPAMQIREVKLGKRSGFRTTSLTLGLHLSSGDDEFVLTLT